MAEVLITLGILGVVMAMTFPGLISKYEKARNLSVLKKAYAEIQTYFLDFQNDTGCYYDVDGCYPENYQFQEEFARYLYEKKKFQDRFPNTGNTTWYMPYVSFNQDFNRDGRYAVVFKSMAAEGRNAHMLVAPSGLYMLGVDANTYDNHYCFSKPSSVTNRRNCFRAMLWLYVDNRKFGRKYGGYGLGTNSSKEFSRLGKQLFNFFIMSDGTFIPNGSSLCKNGNGALYHCQYWKESNSCNPESTSNYRNGLGCLGRIMEDSWQIKYRW